MRGKSCLLVLAFLPCLNEIVHAQNRIPFSTLTFSLGVTNIQNKDAFKSPYTYRGNGLLINAHYVAIRSRGRHIIDLMYSGGKQRSIVSPDAENKMLRLNYDYLFNLKTKTLDEIFAPSVGMGVHALFSNTNYLPDIESPVSYLSGAAYLTLTGGVLLRLSKKSSLTTLAGIPLLGLVYRPDFEINGKTLTKSALIGKGSLFSIKLEYDYKLSVKLDLIATCNYSYFTFDEPRPVTILQNGLSIGIRKTF